MLIGDVIVSAGVYIGPRHCVGVMVALVQEAGSNLQDGCIMPWLLRYRYHRA